MFCTYIIQHIAVKNKQILIAGSLAGDFGAQRIFANHNEDELSALLDEFLAQYSTIRYNLTEYKKMWEHMFSHERN